jgi:hypothetical protein
LQKAHDVAVAKGVDGDRAADAVVDALVGQAEATAKRIAETLKRDQLSELLADQVERANQARAAIRDRWGDHLDRFILLRTIVAEVTITFGNDERAKANATRDHVFEVLDRLNALALRIAMEVYHLLENGYPAAALARCRTMHEVGISAWVIAEFGRDDRYPSLALRYLLHNEAKDYDRALARSKSDDVEIRPSEEELASLKARHDALVDAFGGAFKREWGWAAILFDNANDCTLANLEALVDLSSLRRQYASTSAHVHGNSSSSALNIFDDGEGRTYKTTDVTLDGLEFPLGQASSALANVATAFIVKGRPESESMTDLLAINVVRELLEGILQELQADIDSFSRKSTYD